MFSDDRERVRWEQIDERWKKGSEFHDNIIQNSQYFYFDSDSLNPSD